MGDQKAVLFDVLICKNCHLDTLNHYETYLGLLAAIKHNPDDMEASSMMALVYCVQASMSTYDKWKGITTEQAFDELRKVLKIQNSKSMTLGHAIGAYIYQRL